MTSEIDKLKHGEYYDEDGNQISIEFLPGLSDEQIEKLKNKIPNKNIPENLIQLLKHCSGLETSYFDRIEFDNIEQFGFNELIQLCLTLAGDGAGNFWVQEINSRGEWGAIYFVCHDPAVLLKQANSLKEFLSQLNEHFTNTEESFITEVSDRKLIEIYENDNYLIKYEEAINSGDKVLKNFVTNFDSDWYIGDLRNAKNGDGFRLEASYDKTIRDGDNLIWALKKQVSIWSRIKELFKG